MDDAGAHRDILHTDLAPAAEPVAAPTAGQVSSIPQ